MPAKLDGWGRPAQAQLRAEESWHSLSGAHGERGHPADAEREGGSVQVEWCQAMEHSSHEGHTTGQIS